MNIAFYKINWYIEDYDGSKYLTLIPVDQKDTDALEEYKEILDKTKFPLKLKNKNSMIMVINTWTLKLILMINYFQKKTFAMRDVVIRIRTVFHNENKYYIE